MKFTDIFIHRPVLSSVVSLLILVMGARALGELEVREYPETSNTVVTVTTVYPGASSELIQGFITTPLQQAMAEARGIDFLVARSTQSVSTIEAHMELNYDPNAAVAEIQAKVASQRGVLPAEAEDPVIDATTGDDVALMYLVFTSGAMSPSQITDYLLRVVQPALQAVPGVAKAQPFGNNAFAMRVWLDPLRLAAHDISPQEVSSVLAENNFLAAVGQTKGLYVTTDLGATTDVSTEADFRRLIVRHDGDTLVRLEDIARIELGSESYDATSWFNGTPGVVIGVEAAPGSNPLTVAERVHEKLAEIKPQLPEGLESMVAYDASVYINDSIREVFSTLTEALLIVLGVIFLSLGSLRAAIVPAVAVPLSLVGGALLMLMMGFSINLLTLLAMVLAIGLVVDDAIIVVENVHRHVELGKRRFEAAIIGAREIGLPIIAMTTTLVAVYLPIGFMGGLVGTLFTEFAFSLAGAVLVSGVVALTLSPMISSKVLTRHGEPGRFEKAVEHFFNALADAYRRRLSATLDYKPVTLVFAVVVLTSIYFMFVTTPAELAPVEDQSVVFMQGRLSQTATIEYNRFYTQRLREELQTIPEDHNTFLFLGRGSPNTTFGGFKLSPPSERERSVMEVMPEVQAAANRVPGIQAAAFPRPTLPGAARGLPVQFVITTAADFTELDAVANQMLGAAMQSGKFGFLQKSVEFARPRTTLVVDRDRAGDLGISMAAVARSLSTMLGEGYVNRFNLEGRSYKVIPQVERSARLNATMLDEYYLPTASGEQVPLSTLVGYRDTVEPSARTQFQQLNSVTLQGVVAPGTSLGEALAELETLAADIFPQGFTYDFDGESRQYMEQGSSLIVTFFLAILVIYLVLAAQFESWRDPFIILVSVPMSIAGALIFMTLGFATVNIYTQVGLITLIGLISKNGILVVEFANQLRESEGLNRRQAIEKSAAIRLRPVLMTTVAMIMAMVPLLLASGPGAVSRFHIGLVIATGLGIGTLFTLFVLPAVYLMVTAPRAQS
ncbi:efflux RND transporter permease subunit [Elongatibacter sediminis]|uniref:Efflux RND transporter permease subunit n=1 Tax=Elongatibacter sediminis TaxID=3119006 RepID=A0AAW9RG13_9GAMM